MQQLLRNITPQAKVKFDIFAITKRFYARVSSARKGRPNAEESVPNVVGVELN